MSKSMPYLKRAANGAWYVHWTERRIGKRISTGTKDEAAARVFLAHHLLMEQELPLGSPERAALTLADVWAVYDAKRVQPKQSGHYNAALAWKQMDPFFGALPASGMTQDAVDSYVAKRTSGKLGRKVQPQTVTKELAYLVAAVHFCADSRRGLIGPECVRKLSLPPQGEPRDRWLRTDEIQKLLDAAAALRGGDRLSRAERFIWLALETAGRKQALLDLTWDRVDFETNTIRLDAPGLRATKKRRATVPISKALKPVLERALRERTGDLVLDNGGAVWPAIQRIVVKAGLAPDVPVAKGQKPKATGIGPHTFRHTAATHMARRRVPLYIIAAILGNTVAMVTKVYGHHAKEDLQEAVDMISGGVLEASE
jgi:integrase